MSITPSSQSPLTKSNENIDITDALLFNNPEKKTTNIEQDFLKAKGNLEDQKLEKKKDTIDESIEDFTGLKLKHLKESELTDNKILEKITKDFNPLAIGACIAIPLAIWGGLKLSNQAKEQLLKWDPYKKEDDKTSSSEKSDTTNTESSSSSPEESQSKAEIKNPPQEKTDKKIEEENQIPTAQEGLLEKGKHLTQKLAKNKTLKNIAGGGILGTALIYANNPAGIINWGKKNLGVDLRSVKIGGQSLYKNLSQGAQNFSKGHPIEKCFEESGLILNALYQNYKMAKILEKPKQAADLFPISGFLLKKLFQDFENSPEGQLELSLAADPSKEFSPEAKQVQYLAIKYLFDYRKKLETKLEIVKNNIKQRGEYTDVETIDDLSYIGAIELLNDNFTERPYYAQRLSLLGKQKKFGGLGTIDVYHWNLFRGTMENREDSNIARNLDKIRENSRKKIEDTMKSQIEQNRELKNLDLEIRTLEQKTIELKKKIAENKQKGIDCTQLEAEYTQRGQEITAKKNSFDQKLSTTLKNNADFESTLKEYTDSTHKAAKQQLITKHNISREIENRLILVEKNQLNLEDELKTLKNQNPRPDDFKIQEKKINEKIKKTKRQYTEMKLRGQQAIASIDIEFNKKFSSHIHNAQIDYTLKTHFAQHQKKYEKRFRQKNNNFQEFLKHLGYNPTGSVGNARVWEELKAMGIKNPREKFASYLEGENIETNRDTLGKKIKKTKMGQRASKYGSLLPKGMASYSLFNSFLYEKHNFKYDAAEVGLGFCPIAGTYLDAKAAISGRDLAGRELKTWERVTSGIFAGVGAIADITTVFGVGVGIRGAIGAAKAVKNTGKVARTTRALIKAGKGSEEMKHIYNTYSRANDAFRMKSKFGKASHILNRQVASRMTKVMLGYSTFAALEQFHGLTAYDIYNAGTKAIGLSSNLGEIVTDAYDYGQKAYEKTQKFQKKMSYRMDNDDLSKSDPNLYLSPYFYTQKPEEIITRNENAMAYADRSIDFISENTSNS